MCRRRVRHAACSAAIRAIRRSAACFTRGPCFPYYLPPIGQDLRLTITSTDDNDPANKKTGDTDKSSDDAKSGEDSNKKSENADSAADDHALDTIRELFAALRECWVPPPKDEARHGMEYTIRFSFKRDGDVIAPPRMTYVSHDAPGEVRDGLSRCHRRVAQALHAAAFQRRHGRCSRGPADCHPVC